MNTDLINLASDGSRTLGATTPITAPPSVNEENNQNQLTGIDIRDLERRLRRLEISSAMDRGTKMNKDGKDETIGNDDTQSRTPTQPLSWKYAILLAFFGLWVCIGIRFAFEAY